MTTFYLFTARDGEGDTLRELHMCNIQALIKKCTSVPSWTCVENGYGKVYLQGVYRVQQITVPTCAVEHVKRCMNILSNETQGDTYWAILDALPEGCPVVADTNAYSVKTDEDDNESEFDEEDEEESEDDEEDEEESEDDEEDPNNPGN